MKKIIILLLVCFYALPSLAALRARTDALTVQESDVFELEIQTDKDASGAPDLTALKKDFEVLGQGTSQSYQFDGKTKSVQRSLILNLMPKRTGILTIPAITWNGEQTKPIQIEVTPVGNAMQVKDEDAVIIEAMPLSDTTYQGAGFMYQAKVFERIGLIDGALMPPAMADAEVIPLGQSTLSQEEKDGILYQVLTQNYIIFPQKAGKDLSISPAAFKGSYRKAHTNKSLPFGFTDAFIYQPLSSNRGEVFIKAKPSTITVLPPPKEAQNIWWLPSTNVTLNETWQGLEDKIKVGASITRQVELQAIGVLGRMLPDLMVAANNDFKVYPETAQKSETYAPQVGLIGQETQSFVFIPLHAGRLTLPAMSVKWFDVNTGVMKTATLPAKTIDVTGESVAAIQTPIIKKVEPAEEVKITTPQSPLQTRQAKENTLLYFMGGLSFGLILGVIGIIVLHRKTRTKKSKLPDLYPKK